MEVPLSPDLERYVIDLVESGEFATPSDVVVKALTLWKSEREDVLAMIQEGIDDLDNGRSRGGAEVMRDLAVRFAPKEASQAA